MVHRKIKIMPGTNRVRSGTEPKIRAAVMVANCIWKSIKATEGIWGAVCGKACVPSVPRAPALKSPIKGPPVSEKARLKPKRKNWIVTTAIVNMQSIIRDRALLYLDRPE